MRSDDTSDDKLSKCNCSTHGAKIVFIMDANLGEPFGTAWAEVAHLDDRAWHVRHIVAQKMKNDEIVCKRAGLGIKVMPKIS